MDTGERLGYCNAEGDTQKVSSAVLIQLFGIRMLSEVFPLDWTVCAGGYRWAQGQELEPDPNSRPEGLPSGWVLVERWSGFRRVDATPRFYQPDVEDAALFLKFADLPPDDREAMLAFANRYGQIGVSGEVTVLLRPEGAVKDPARVRAMGWEDMSRWSKHIKGLACARRVHDLISKSDRVALRGLLQWVEGHPVLPKWYIHKDLEPASQFQVPSGPDDGAANVANVDWRPIGMKGEPSRRDDPLDVARAWLGQEIGRNLRRLHAIDTTVDFQDGRLQFRLRPHDLLSLMWLQFARAVATGRQYRPCKECGAEFEILPKDKGRKLFCGVGCKLKDYRARQRKVSELEAEGQTPVEIAAKLGMDVKTIKAWTKAKSASSKKKRQHKGDGS